MTAEHELPEGVEYEVRDADGNLLEIVTTDGQRIYVAPEPEPEPDAA
jgi:YD repeat-containing protein